MWRNQLKLPFGLLPSIGRWAKQHWWKNIGAAVAVSAGAIIIKEKWFDDEPIKLDVTMRF
jgi:hypothetical protein